MLDMTSDSSVFALMDHNFEEFRRRIQNKNEEIAKHRKECQRIELEDKLRAEQRQ